MADYPLVKVSTSDGFSLDGMLIEGNKKKSILIHIHGSAGNFYENPFIRSYAATLPKLGISFLSTNNRGNAVSHDILGLGAAHELFEDCLKDINAWVGLAKNLGYEKIILQGHSFGTEKAVYYMNYGKYRKDINGVVLLGFCDTIGTQEIFLKKIGKENQELLKEAESLMAQDKGYEFSSIIYNSICGELPASANTYVNFFSKDSELSRTMPLRDGKALPRFRNIHVPVLGVIGDRGEYTIIPIKKAMALLEKENPLAQCYQIKHCGHNYDGKTDELMKIVNAFLKKTV